MSDEPHHSGTIALIGRPNAGKSTLLNAILGQKLSIVSHRPQTTRRRLIGIHSEPGLQVALVDTPGLHAARDRINQAMVDAARDSADGVDVTTWVVDARRCFERMRDGSAPFHKGHDAIATMLSERDSGALVVALNKIDRVPRPQLLPLLAAFAERLPHATFVPISALKGSGLDRLLAAWKAALPECPPLYPTDQLTDATERFLVSELIREKLFVHLRQEVPYGVAVVIEDFEQREAREGQERGVVAILARIIVERDPQRGIVIGKGGGMLKRVGTEARADIEELLGTRVHLDMHVSVRKDWTTNPRMLQQLGLN